MQSYGSDRLRHDGERWVLSSRSDKGWTARKEKTLTTAEFPGTAVLCDDAYFEVVRAEPLSGGVRYVLEPWREQHAIRVSERYDAASEEQRAAARRDVVRRERNRKTANALALLAGYLPAVVQQHLASEIGIVATRMTIASIVFSYVIAAALVLLSVSRVMTNEALPFALLIVAGFIAAENTIRWMICWTQSRPIGSIPGSIVYAIYYAVTRRGLSPFAVEKGNAVPITSTPDEVAKRDALTMREALVTLLTPGEQDGVARRYGYDYRRESRTVAAIILAVAVVGIVSSYRSGAMLALIVAVILAVEQIVRFASFPKGPAASMLRFVVRPFVRRLL